MIVAFESINKDDNRTIQITAIAPSGAAPKRIDNRTWELPLEPHTDVVSFNVSISSSTTSTAQKTTNIQIDYQRMGVLISHQCGCAHKYVLKKIQCGAAEKIKIINKELSIFNTSNIDVQISF